MNTNALMLAFQLTVRLPEIVISLLGALILGFTIHFFWNSRKTMDLNVSSGEDGISDNDNWKLKYYNDMDMQEKAQQQLRERVTELQENEQILTIELEEAQKELKNKLYSESVTPSKIGQTASTDDYLTQLKSAQENLFQHNQHVNRLLEQIQLLKESERKFLEVQKANEQLNQQLLELRKTLAEKDSEIGQIRQQQRITEELSQRLEKAYTEYRLLQEKVQKLEGYLSKPDNRSIQYDELHAAYFRLTKDFDEIKNKQVSLWEENQRLSRILADTEDKLREANFQRQQLQKKTSFLEEMNKDLQEASEHNKKLESQLRRISEMESMLIREQPGKKDWSREQ
jgi:myosin heavy subunit